MGRVDPHLIKVLLGSNHRLTPIGTLLLPKLIYLVNLRQQRIPDQVSDSQAWVKPPPPK